MKKMAFVDLTDFHAWPVGGMIRYELQILEILTSFYEIDLWGVSVDGNQPKPVLINGKEYPVHIFGAAKKSRRLIPNYWKGLLIGKQWSALEKYDIIYAHTGSCAVACAMKRGNGKALLAYHQHGLNYLADFSLKTLLQRPFMYLAQKMSDVTFVVTGKEELHRYASNKSLCDRLVQIGSPVEAKESSYKSLCDRRTGKTFIYVGRLSPIKRVHMVVDAFDEFCRKRGNDFQLLIVGDGEEGKRVRKQAEKLEFAKNILLTGTLDSNGVDRYLQLADFYITASAGEGVSVAVLEAFRAGLPVICFSVRGLGEQVEDGRTGIIAQEESVAGLVEAMERAYISGDEMTEHCVEESRKYTPERIGRQIMEELERRDVGKKNQCNYSGL